MSRIRIALNWSLCFAGLAVVACSGCRTPWYEPSDVPQQSEPMQAAVAIDTDRAPDSVARRLANGTKPVADVDPFDLPKPEASQQQAMAQVLEQLREVRAIDADSEQELMHELRQAKPDHWPLLVQNFRAALAMRQRLADSQDQPSTMNLQQPQPAIAASSKHAPPPVQHANWETPRQSDSLDGPVEPEVDLAIAFATDQPEVTSSHVEKAAPATDDVSDRWQPQEPDTPLTTTARRESLRAIVQRAVHVEADGDAIEPDIATTEASDTWQHHLQRAIERLEAQTSSAPANDNDVALHAKLRLLHAVAGNQEQAVTPIEGVSAKRQDFWAKQLFAVTTFLDTESHVDIRRRATLAQRHFTQANDLLGELGMLSVHNLAFSENIRGFGLYEPMHQPTFAAGQQVNLYAEVQNYRSEATDDGFHAQLASSYEIRDEGGRRIDAAEFPPVDDHCKSRRHDFHIQYMVTLPKRIYPGRYHLELTIEDSLAHKIGRSTVAFEVE